MFHICCFHKRTEFEMGLRAVYSILLSSCWCISKGLFNLITFCLLPELRALNELLRVALTICSDLEHKCMWRGLSLKSKNTGSTSRYPVMLPLEVLSQMTSPHFYTQYEV